MTPTDRYHLVDNIVGHLGQGVERFIHERAVTMTVKRAFLGDGGAQCCGPGSDLPICVTPCRVARMNTRKDILTRPGNNAHEYVGRHRKPEHDRKDPPTDTSSHRAYELFTHGTQPIHITKQK
jgi:hypothetical protein